MFCLFVLALAVVVRAGSSNGLRDVVDALVPSGHGLPALLGIAAVGAVLANLVNNLPATLLLLPAVAPSGTAAVLALLVGVNVGPNLTYAGSLATLLWRRGVRARDNVPRLVEFTRLGLATVPVSLLAGVLGVWLSARVIGT
jgi:arsenical pump membrane protein